MNKFKNNKEPFCELLKPFLVHDFGIKSNEIKKKELQQIQKPFIGL